MRYPISRGSNGIFKALLGVGAAWAMVMVMMAIGWIMNLAWLFKHINDPVSTMTILRAAGVILFPVGGILGWF